MTSVFISYRRETGAGEARALYTDLVSRLGENAVFMDVDSISLGRDFRTELHATLEACDLMLVVIDKNWATATDERGRKRLDNPQDFVRMEIEAALKRNIVVTPVLVDGARMPAAEDLPAEISDLAYRNGFEVSHSRWASDFREMSRRLKLEPPGQAGAPTKPLQPAEVAVAATPASAPTRETAKLRTYLFAGLGVGVVAIGAGYGIWKGALNGPVERPPTPAAANAKMTIYTQIKAEDDKGKFEVLRRTLPEAKYAVQPYEVKAGSGQNQVKYCYSENKKDAVDLKALLDSKGFNKFGVVEIGGNCTAVMKKDVLEVWLQ